LFEGFGIEMEYMMVKKDSLATLPISDKILREMSGEDVMEYSFGEIAWSNELVKHVLEIKSDGPKANLVKLHKDMVLGIQNVNKLLADHGGMLLPTSMHPLFHPEKDTVLWDQENAVIYKTYDQIFGCKGHGWSNLQSVHINLPFLGDEEFGRLHAAVRLVLPLIPAFAASSPLVEGKKGPFDDSRLFYYLQNQRRIPSILGQAIPERAFTEREYLEMILEPMYRDIAPKDPEGTLQDEWLNSRGAIARFQRNAIEIRLLDIQECPRMDFGLISLIVATVRALVDETWSSTKAQRQLDETRLRAILDGCLAKGLDFEITDAEYLDLFAHGKKATVKSLLTAIVSNQKIARELSDFADEVHLILEKGTLARRILRALNGDFSRDKIVSFYGKLARCLENDTAFVE
jgi:gamma-glutamyl:cysteine ligase YbdK (ATP-grasp superfamily)